MLLPSARNSNAMSNRKARQLLVHQVPVRFPVAGNLMESAVSIGYVYDALESISAPGDLPGDVLINATLLNSLENNKDRATLIVELDTVERCNQILRNAKHKREQEKGFAYYVTPTPQRRNSRYISNSDEEIHSGNSAEHKRSKKSDKKHKHKHTLKAKEKEPKPNNRVTKCRHPQEAGKGPRKQWTKGKTGKCSPYQCINPITKYFKNKPECINRPPRRTGARTQRRGPCTPN